MRPRKEGAWGNHSLVNLKTMVFEFVMPSFLLEGTLLLVGRCLGGCWSIHDEIAENLNL